MDSIYFDPGNPSWLSIGSHPTRLARLRKDEIASYFLDPHTNTVVTMRSGFKHHFSGDLMAGLDAQLGIEFDGKPAFTAPNRHF